MLNPLSLIIGQTISGKEINDWCKDQIINNKSHQKIAKFLLSKGYKDNRIYCKTYKQETGNNKPSVIIFMRSFK